MITFGSVIPLHDPARLALLLERKKYMMRPKWWHNPSVQATEEMRQSCVTHLHGRPSIAGGEFMAGFVFRAFGWGCRQRRRLGNRLVKLSNRQRLGKSSIPQIIG